MLRLPLALAVLLLVACTSGPATSPPPTASPGESPDALPTASPRASPADPATPAATASPLGHGPAGLVADLDALGIEVEQKDDFEGAPFSTLGTLVCVAGEPVRVYVFGTVQEAAAAASRIDPTDPSNLGTVIVEWTGEPKFWLRDRIMVLYLGTHEAVTAALISVLGEPFARSTGRGPTLGGDDC